MPLINVQPRDMQDGTRITYFNDSVGTSSTTYTFAANQEMIMLRNKGSKDINYTIGATSGVLGRGELIKVNGSFSSVVLSSSQGTQAFEIISDEIGTISGSADYTNLASQVAERVKTVNGVAPDASGNVVISTGGAGGGSLVYSTLAALQAAYPGGTTQPAWVNADNAWYYWSGSVTEPPVEPPAGDTTPPVLTITPAATFTDTKTVTMSANETATIFYTLDDTDPKTSGTKLTYTVPLTLTETDTIKAYAKDTTGNESAVQTVTYTKQAATIKNIFDKNTMVIAGSYVNPSGVVTASAGTAYAKIPVKPNTAYSIQPRADLLSAYGRTGAARGKLAFSNDGTTALSSIDMKTETTINNTSDSNSYWFYFTTPANCNYILMTTLISSSDWKDTMQVEEGNTIHDYYLAYA